MTRRDTVGAPVGPSKGNVYVIPQTHHCISLAETLARRVVMDTSRQEQIKTNLLQNNAALAHNNLFRQTRKFAL